MDSSSVMIVLCYGLFWNYIIVNKKRVCMINETVGKCVVAINF